MPGAGHIANLEAPAAVNALLRAHLDAAEAARMTEWRWIEAFTRAARGVRAERGEVVAVLSESASRRELVETRRLAAQRLGGRVVDVVVPTPANPGPVPIRSTGASVALQGNRAAVAGAGRRRPRHRLHRRGADPRARARRDPAAAARAC